MNDDSNKTYDGKFKLKVALAATKGDKSVDDLCQEFGVLTSQIYAWKNHLEEHGAELFADKRKTENKIYDNEKKLQATLKKVLAERDFLVRVLNH